MILLEINNKIVEDTLTVKLKNALTGYSILLSPDLERLAFLLAPCVILAFPAPLSNLS